MPNTAKATETATPCECSKYDALPGDLTEAQIESGDYTIWNTGCASTTRNLFAPGHDAKLKSFLIKHEANGNEVRRNEGGVAITTDAAGHASRYDFAHMVIAGVAKAKAKAQAKAEREAARAERKAAKGAGAVSKPLAEVVAKEEAKHAAEVAASRPAPEWDDEPKVAPVLEDEAAMNTAAREERERGLVVAKVGRWEYEGAVNENGTFTYLAKDGQTRKTVDAGKFAVVREV